MLQNGSVVKFRLLPFRLSTGFSSYPQVIPNKTLFPCLNSFYYLSIYIYSVAVTVVPVETVETFVCFVRQSVI